MKLKKIFIVLEPFIFFGITISDFGNLRFIIHKDFSKIIVPRKFIKSCGDFKQTPTKLVKSLLQYLIIGSSYSIAFAILISPYSSPLITKL